MIEFIIFVVLSIFHAPRQEPAEEILPDNGYGFFVDIEEDF